MSRERSELTIEEIKVMPTPFDRSPEADSGGPGSWRAYRGNRGLASAFRKGGIAAVEGKPLSACPYDDIRTRRGGVTFSRAFERAWGEGWHQVKLGDRNACTLTPVHRGECRLRAS